jgi:S-formylglutathione hydrolase FrmB
MILHGTFNSQVLHRHTNIAIAAPDAFGGEPYKVVYLLHGLRVNADTWIDQTMLPVLAQQYKAIFIMPDVGRSFYRNMKYGLAYFSFVSEELPQVAAQYFNISTKREDAAVIGCSMGGYGALKCAFSFPERYGFCGAISSAALFMNEQMDALKKDPAPILKQGGSEVQDLYRDVLAIFGDDLVYNDSDIILELAKRCAESEDKPRVYMACGSDDPLHNENRRFKTELSKLDIDSSYEEWQGAHEWRFFSEALERAMQIWNVTGV